MQFLAKDFIETAQGLRFAVVVNGSERGKVLCFLRYIQRDKHWVKVNTEAANQYLNTYFPQYQYESPLLAARLHAVDLPQITRHFQPRVVLQQLLSHSTNDPVLIDFQNLCRLLQANGLDLAQWGVTGSILLGCQQASSDMDLVCYQRHSFQQARQLIARLIQQNHCQNLTHADWLESYQRRACDLSLVDYIWHEQRKFNKALFNQRKFDLSLLVDDAADIEGPYQKLGFKQLEAMVTDDRYGFDYPARFAINHPEIACVVSFTATYNGQAQTGENILVAGQVEVNTQGQQRLVVGSSREAVGEFIQVIR